MKKVYVAVGLVFDEQGKILIAKRPKGKYMAGIWEFPGGKLEQGETPEEALVRELNEEVDILPSSFEPFTQVDYTYKEQRVFLEVYRVSAYSGVAKGRERQDIKWVFPSELFDYQFPKANEEIISLLV